MPVFNSLGSNYNLRFALRALFTSNNPKHNLKLKTYLERKYQGKAVLLYKGRESIKLALSLMNLSKDAQIAINGFTCYAVYKAIVDAGFEPVYLDIDNLNFSSSALADSLKKNPKIRAVIVQNTLGFLCEIEKIARICKQRSLILIEDMAHCVGTVYKNGKEAGTMGDFAAFSFSQDKVIDAISGGALIIRNKTYQKTNSVRLNQIPNQQQILDQFYPLFTYVIRHTYRIYLGKIIHLILKRLNLLSNPMGKENAISLCQLPYWYCNLVSFQFMNLQNKLAHRKKIASIYAKNIVPKLLLKSLPDNINLSTNIRFPIFADKRDNLISYLRKHHIYVSDIWYDAPLAPKKYLHLTNYRHQCPMSEKASDLMLNLPTHENVSLKDAESIAERINQWQKLQ
jgi:dTDP-4-amino-4,6-dideoxygalactose transaminase